MGYANNPYFVFTFPKIVLQTEMPSGVKIPKFTKFAAEVEESTVEHIAKFLIKCGDLANHEYLKMKYFPSSLTKMFSHGLPLYHPIRYILGIS